MTESSRTEELDTGIKIEWYDDDTIIVFSGMQQSRPIMDSLAQKVIEETSRTHSKIRHILDVSANMAVITPYLRSKVKEINQANPDVIGYVAIIVKETLMTQAIRLFINREMARQQPGIKLNIYFNREDALVWLRAQSFE